MNEVDNNQQALMFAHTHHNGQLRRDGITPYIYHVREVVRRLTIEKASDEAIQVGWLHDLLEDTQVTAEDLAGWGFSPDVVEAVVLLTRVPNQLNEIYLARIKYNTLAKQVKIADMLSNLADTPTKKQIIKYSKSLLYLLDGD